MTIQEDRCSMIDESESGVAERGQSVLAYDIRVMDQGIKVSKRLDAAIDKIYSGFYSLKEPCNDAYKICKDGIQEDLIWNWVIQNE